MTIQGLERSVYWTSWLIFFLVPNLYSTTVIVVLGGEIHSLSVPISLLISLFSLFCIQIQRNHSRCPLFHRLWILGADLWISAFCSYFQSSNCWSALSPTNLTVL